MTTSTTYPLLCGIRRRGVSCHAPATSAVHQAGACGCSATTYTCDDHPAFQKAQPPHLGRCAQCGELTMGAVTERRPVHEGDLPDTPGAVIIGRWNGGREIRA